MRILIINYEYPPVGGGGGKVTRALLEHMAQAGHETTVLTSCSGGLKKFEMCNGVNIVRVPVLFRKKLEVANMPSMLSFLPAGVISGFIKFGRDQFDIINTHFAIPSGPTGYFLSKIFRLPNILSIHGGDIYDPSKRLSPHQTPLLSNTVRSMLNTADRVVAQSNDTRNNAYQYYGINRPIDVIPLGITKPVFAPKPRNQLGLGADDFVFCTIGRLVKRKNIDDILVALSSMRNSYKLKLIVIGEGPEATHLINLTHRFNLEDNVIFAGNVSDEKKFQLLQVSDCYLSTALHEGFGLVFLEAMETGCPVICYNRGGQNDFLVDGKTGFLVNLGDRKKFAEKIIELMNDSDLCTRISVYNRQLVRNYYISACAEKYIALFSDTIAQIHAARKAC